MFECSQMPWPLDSRNWWKSREEEITPLDAPEQRSIGRRGYDPGDTFFQGE